MSTVPPAAPAPTTRQRGRFAVLDALRAIAVLSVIVYHVIPGAAPAGFLGVDLFFVLSGFLITRGLLGRLEREAVGRGEAGPALGRGVGRIDVKRYFLDFYTKRVRRLLPAFAFMLVSVCTLALLSPEDVRVRLGRQVLGAVTSTANWVQLATGTSYFDAGTPQLLKHMWSLSVEEQFYLVWPGVILLAALTLKAGSLPMLALRKRLRTLTLAGAVLSAVAMAIVYATTKNANLAYLNSLTHSTGLLLGAFVACMRPYSFSSVLARAGAMLGGVVVASYVFATLSDTSPATELGGIAVFSAAIAVIVRVGTTGSLSEVPSESPLFRPVRWVADRSYAMYLWHWPLVVLAAAWIPDQNGGDVEPSIVAARAAVVVIPTFLLSEISYRLFERPVLAKGFRASWRAAAKRPYLRPSIAFVAAAATCATVVAAVTAPAKTTQQVQLEALQSQAQALAEENAKKKTQEPGKPGSEKTPAPVETGPGSAASEGIDSSEVTFVGDSVTVAALPTINSLYPKSPVQATVGEQIWTADEVVHRLDGEKKLGRILVVALGANGTFTQENLDRVVKAAGPDRKVVLVTPYGPQPWIADATSQIHTYADGHKDNTRIADWAEAAKKVKDMAPDGVHPGPEGARIWLGEITRAIKSF